MAFYASAHSNEELAKHRTRLTAVLDKWEARTRRTWNRATLNGGVQGLMLVALRAAPVGFDERGHELESLAALRKRIWMTLVNALIGFWIGVLPGTGATPASFLSYGIGASLIESMISVSW